MVTEALDQNEEWVELHKNVAEGDNLSKSLQLHPIIYNRVIAEKVLKKY